MQFMTALFGESASILLNAAFSLGIVLALIVLGLWALKLFTKAGDRMARGKQPRLVVVDSANVDGKRKVLIVRRDNVEHLIMTGGPQDLVIETGIPAPDTQQPTARAARPAAPGATATGSIETTASADKPVSQEAVDRLFDLARPAPLEPRTSLRHTALLRPVSRQDSDVIPMGPALRGENSAGTAGDSAKSGSVDPMTGRTGVGGRNRFFRNVVRDRS